MINVENDPLKNWQPASTIIEANSVQLNTDSHTFKYFTQKTFTMTKQIYPCLWFDGQAKAAADFYCSIFKDAKITTENQMVVIFELNNTKFMALNGGPMYKPTEAVSFVVDCESQEEIDHYWNQLSADGGQESMCGWVKDKFGFSWQIIPANLGSLLSKPNAMPALMQMKKIDIATLENA
jgi:predicted 3-demethylubiquinone-9 3-methyltransferase (glyoxalase superfamily)